MKVIILLGGIGKRMRPHTWSRPKPLLNVAGNTVLGHILDLMKAVTTDEVIFVVGYRGDQVEIWVREHYPHLDAHFVRQEEALGQAHAVWLCRDYLVNNPAGLLVAFGDGLIDADYRGLAEAATQQNAEAILYVKEEEDPRDFGVVVQDETGAVTRFIEKPTDAQYRQVVVGLTYFHHGDRLFQAADHVIRRQQQNHGEYYMADLYTTMIAQGRRLITRPVRQWSDTGQLRTVLATNNRMLAIGYHSSDAIERSYAEEFLVIPPVYLHPQAGVKNSVIGPFATIGANAVIQDAVVRHCVIDAGATITNCIVDQALVGENARVTGRAVSMFIGDDAVVEL